jgi:hypothetical protein
VSEPATKLRTGNPSAVRQFISAALVAGAYVGVDRLHKGDSLLASVPDNDRSEFYISIAASSAALLGFAITAASILSALGSGPRITWLRQQDEFKQTRVVLIGAMRALGISTVLFSALILTDTDADGRVYLEVAASAVVAVVVTRIVWVLWLLNELLALAVVDDESIPLPNPPFKEPMDDP